MNLTEPLAGLMSPVESGALRLLARSDQGFSGREVQRLSGAGSVSSVHRALGRLVHVGLVEAEERPPAIVYRANRDHLLWTAIESAIGARASLFDRIRSFAARSLDRFGEISVIVYGSVARRESTSESDIDLFVVVSDDLDADGRAELGYTLASAVERWSGNTAQIYMVDEHGLARMMHDSDPVLHNAQEDGLLVAGTLPQALHRVVTA